MLPFQSFGFFPQYTTDSLGRTRGGGYAKAAEAVGGTKTITFRANWGVSFVSLYGGVGAGAMNSSLAQFCEFTFPVDLGEVDVPSDFPRSANSLQVWKNANYDARPAIYKLTQHLPWGHDPLDVYFGIPGEYSVGPNAPDGYPGAGNRPAYDYVRFENPAWTTVTLPTTKTIPSYRTKAAWAAGLPAHTHDVDTPLTPDPDDFGAFFTLDPFYVLDGTSSIWRAATPQDYNSLVPAQYEKYFFSDGDTWTETGVNNAQLNAASTSGGPPYSTSVVPASATIWARAMFKPSCQWKVTA